MLRDLIVLAVKSAFLAAAGVVVVTCSPKARGEPIASMHHELAMDAAVTDAPPALR